MSAPARDCTVVAGDAVLTARQRRAAMLLAQGHPVTAVAAELAMATSTLWRWRQTAGFQALVRGQLDALEAAAHDQLRAALPVAIAGLVELAQQREMPAVRLGACNAITRVWAKHVEEVEVRQELDDLQTRLAGLMEQLREQQTGWGA
jgi:hypothetical protein